MSDDGRRKTDASEEVDHQSRTEAEQNSVRHRRGLSVWLKYIFGIETLLKVFSCSTGEGDQKVLL